MNQPQKTGEFDAVLGGSNRGPEGAAVLGGIQGLLIHYQDPNPHNRMVIIQQALNHGKKGTDFLLEVMKNDDSWEVKDLAYELLLSKDRELAKSSGYIDTTNMPQVFLKLNSLLQAQNFTQADLETRKIILAIAKREKEGYLRIEDAEKFPCKELRSIDKLWLKYSGGKFGISVQQQIYQSLGGTKKYNRDVWESMAQRVGWNKDAWLYLDGEDHNFSQTAPTGHLPCVLSVARGWQVGQWGQWALEFNLHAWVALFIVSLSNVLGDLKWVLLIFVVGFSCMVFQIASWVILSCCSTAQTLLLRHAECNT
jgi:hypothetical protein